MGEVDIESHNMGPTFYRLASLWFHVNRPSHSWDSQDTAFSKFDHENSKVKVMGEGNVAWKSQSGCNILSAHIPFFPCQSALPFLIYSIFKIWPWKSKVKVKWPWCCTTTGLGLFHRTSNGINPSSGEIWVPQRLAQVLPDLTRCGQWASPYGASGQMTMTVHNYGPRQFHRISNGENPPGGYRDMGSASLAAACPSARPNRDDNTPPARRPERQKWHSTKAAPGWKKQWTPRRIQGERPNNKVLKNEIKHGIDKQITEMIRKRTQKETEHKTKTKHWWETAKTQLSTKGLNTSKNSTKRCATLSQKLGHQWYPWKWKKNPKENCM